MYWLRLLCIILPLGLAGCGLHNYDYRPAAPIADGAGKTSIAVVGVDNRQYLKDGEIKPFYVGLVRDVMVAYPYRVRTTSYNPLSDDLAVSLATGLQKAGYRATSVTNPNPGSHSEALTLGQSSGQSRILLVRIYEFESDTQIRTEFFYDIDFEIYDKSGRLLGSNRIRDQKMYPGSPLPYAEAREQMPKRVRHLLAEGVKPLLKF